MTDAVTVASKLDSLSATLPPLMSGTAPADAAALCALTVMAALLARPAWRRIQLSRAKHKSIAGHSKWGKRIARLLPLYEFSSAEAFSRDGAGTTLARRRHEAFFDLGYRLLSKAPTTIALGEQTKNSISDMQFIGRYRVPFPFSKLVRTHLRTGSFLRSASGFEVCDLDGNRYIDLTGSFGVNVWGIDFYRECMNQAMELAEPLGPVLGSYHPMVADNVERLRTISGLDEVSFHMSGTEAVMQAVRLARYHTRKPYLVRFCGAYHGWWGDVQPGIGNPSNEPDTLTLADMSEHTLTVLRTRNDIACVLINPLQALHPNINAPGDSSLIVDRNNTPADRQDYSQWLQSIAEICRKRGIVFIMDEVFMGFRLGLRGAQDYFNVQADMVTYGKTLGGGFPVGVLCGQAQWMKRFREDRPADICFARGTFNSHPHVMAAMNVFLKRMDSNACSNVYARLESVWNERLKRFNDLMQSRSYPVSAEALSTVWTLNFLTPSRYHWMLQYYLRDAGLALSWVGSGRLIFCVNMDEDVFEQVLQRFDSACIQMKEGGWWECPLSRKALKRVILKETLSSVFSGGAYRAAGQSTLPASVPTAQTSKA